MFPEEFFEELAELGNYWERIEFLRKNEKFITPDFILYLLYHCEVFVEQGEFSIALELCEFAKYAFSGKIKNDALKLHFLLEEVKLLFRKNLKDLAYERLGELKKDCRNAAEDIKGGFLLDIGILYQENGYLEESFSCFIEAKNIYEKINDNQGLIAAMTDLGVNCCERNDLEDAKNYFHQALSLSYENNEGTQNFANIFMGIGYTFDLKGKYSEAKEYYSKALDVSKKLPDKLKYAHILYNLAFTNKRMYFDNLSFDLYRESCEILRELDIAFAESCYFFYRGVILRELEHWEEVIRSWGKGLACLERAGKGHNKKTIEFYLGELKDLKADYVMPSDSFFCTYSYRGKREFSLAPYKDEWRKNTEENLLDQITDYKFASPRGEYNIFVSCLKNLGYMYLGKNRFKKALEAFREILSLQWKNGDFSKLVDTLEGLGKTYRGLKKEKQALVFYSEAAHRSISLQGCKSDDFDEKENWLYLFLGQPEFAFLLWSMELNEDNKMDCAKSIANLFRLARLYQSLDLNKQASFFIDNAQKREL